MNRILSERVMKGWDQQELADRAGVSKTTVSNWESGGNIQQYNLTSLRSLFCCDIDWLLGLTDERRTVKSNGGEGQK